MNLTIDLYLTSKKDALPDLDTYREESEFYRWKSSIKSVAFYNERFNEITDKIFNEAKKYTILEGCAIIEYPYGKVLEADDEIGEKLKELFEYHGYPFNWKLTRDEKAAPDTYLVSLEIVVDKGEQEGGSE
ncbi:MAG: hypothetical protein B6U86_02860 [Candidatus Altiarchaeales archaeon ex4484_43]|nr:MAG: hypothetical protein B6U86_02860 [Candidatus Altiarchaeales archaeon ex4484_43]RLI89647.1 MAG: hypothetical protein DRO62_01190 [Candidatus Altiarchaeales archaeon]